MSARDRERRLRGERSDAARRGWETRRRRARIEQTLSKVEELAEYARATARGLRLWSYSQRPQAVCTGDEIHPAHAANRLDKLAEQLSNTKRRTDK